MLLTPRDSEGKLLPLEFPEIPFTGSLSVEGCSRIESEIFDSILAIRTMVNKLGQVRPAQSISVSDDADTYLTQLELRKYKSAILIQRRDLISRYESLIESRREQESKASDASAHAESSTEEKVPVTPATIETKG